MMVAVRPAELLREWDGHDLIRFAAGARRLELSEQELITTSGAGVV